MIRKVQIAGNLMPNCFRAMLFGSGADGDLTVDGGANHNMSSDEYRDNVFITAGGSQLVTITYTLYVRNTLDLSQVGKVGAIQNTGEEWVQQAQVGQAVPAA